MRAIDAGTAPAWGRSGAVRLHMPTVRSIGIMSESGRTGARPRSLNGPMPASKQTIMRPAYCSAAGWRVAARGDDESDVRRHPQTLAEPGDADADADHDTDIRLPLAVTGRLCVRLAVPRAGCRPGSHAPQWRVA